MFASYRARMRLRKLTTNWVEYRNLVVETLQAGKSTPKQEKRFLALKARIAAALPLIEQTVPKALSEETAQELALVTKLLNATESLKSGLPSDERDLQDFERYWHERYMFLNKLRGTPLPKEEKKRTKKKVKAPVPTGIPIRRKPRTLPRFSLIGFAMRFLVFAAVVYVLGRAIGVRLNAGRQLVFEAPTTMSEFGQNLMLGLNSLWQGATQVMDPVIAAYGMIAGLVMVGVLLLGIGYWVFVRG